MQKTKEINAKTLNEEFAGLEPVDIIKKAYALFGEDLVLTTSGGKTSQIVPKLLREALSPSEFKEIPIVFVDTLYLPRETRDNVRNLASRGHNVLVYKPRLTREEIENKYGSSWWKDGETFKEVVSIIKHEPLNRAFRELGAKAWMNGVMAFQNHKRMETDLVEEMNGLIRIHPIINWKREKAKSFIEGEELPYNKHHFDIAKGPDQSSECGIREKCGIVDQ